MGDAGDDFGDLYADIAIQANSAIIGAPDFVRFYEDDTNKAKDFASGSGSGSGSKEPDSGDADSSRKSENEEPNTMDYGSDSEDDFNIVLNDEAGQRFPVRGAVGVVGGSDGDDGDGMEQGFAGGERGNGAKGGYHLPFSQYKYIRSHSTGYSSHIKIDGASKVASKVASFSHMSARGDWEENNQLKCSSLGDVASTCSIAAPLVAQGGYGFSLPWYRSILDVNIDTFELKPWRHPGVDLTDFFNFGFNEETWKKYCNCLEQYRRQMYILNQTPMYHYSKPSQTTEGGVGHGKDIQEHVCKQGNIVSLASKSTERLELPKGRAIQVEGSTGERQPSMDVRRPRQRDSDVVIHIAVQDSVDDDIDHIDGTNDESSENGDTDCYGCGDGNKSCLDNNATLESSSDRKRSSKLSTASNPVSLDSDNVGNEKLPDVVKHCSQNKNLNVPEGIYEVVDALSNRKEKVGRKTCSADPRIMETELSLDERVSHSPSLSCDGSYFGTSQDSSYVDPEKNQNARRNPSSNLLTNKPESIASDYYLDQNSKKKVVKTGQIEHKGPLRNRSPVQEAQKHHGSRTCSLDELPCCSDDDDVASPMSKTVDSLYDRDDSSVGHGRQKARLHDFYCHDDDVSPMSNSEGLHYNHYLSGGCRRLKERLHDSGSYDDDFYPMSETEPLRDQGHSFSSRYRQKGQLLSFDFYDREGFSYYRETDFSFNYRSEKFAYNHVRTVYAKNPRRKDHWSFGDKRYPYSRNKYIFRKRITRVENKMMEPDWHHCERNGSVEDIHHLTHRESRQLVLKYSYSGKEKDTRWRKKNDELPRGPDNNDDLFQCRNSDDYAQEKSRRSFPIMWKQRNSLADKSGRYMPNSGQKGNFYGGAKRYKDSHLDLDRDHSWCIGVEDEYEKPVDHRFLSSKSYREPNTTNGRNDLNDSRLTERHGIDGRQKCQGFGESDWFGHHNDVYHTENGVAVPDDQVHIGRRRSRHQYESLLCTKKKLISSYLDENLYDKEASLSYERARHTKIHAKYGPAYAGMLIHDKKLQQKKCRRIREGRSDNFINWSSNGLGQSNHEQAITRSRESVDLVVGEGKSFGRSSKARSAMRHDRLEDMGWKVDEEQRTIRVVNKPQRGDCPDKFVETEHAEEGQIIVEETNRDNLMQTKHASESKSPRRNVKRRVGDASRNNVAAECDSQQRILQMRAKMEKREQRFKAPIMQKEPEIVPKPEPEPGLIVEPCETVQQRRVRKRRWNAS